MIIIFLFPGRVLVTVIKNFAILNVQHVIANRNIK